MPKTHKIQHGSFTTIHNEAVKDIRLSWKAKGVFVYLISLPNDWTFHEKEICGHAKDGLTSLNTAVQELRHYKYVNIGKLKTGQTVWDLDDEPSITNHYPLKPITTPRSDKSNLGKPNLVYPNDYKRLNIQKTNSTKRRPKTSKRKPENSSQRPKIIQTVIGYFPTLQTYYKRELLCDSVDDWLKQYTPDQIFNAIDSAQKYQMTVRRVGAPVKFLASTLERQARKAKRQEKKRRRDANDNVDKLIADTKKNDAQEERKIVANAKKKGLI